jgi:adenylate kinase
MNILLLGPQGSGKGTQAKRIAAAYEIPHIATGDMLRAAIEQETELGRRVKPIYDAGELVPDELMVDLIRERLAEDDARDGFILDGYPRTVTQAVQLDRVLEARGQPLQVALELDVPDDEVRARLSRRARLEGRPDDNPETVEARLATWHREAGSLRDHYRDRLRRVDAVGPIDAVVERAKAGLAAAGV